MKLDLRFEEHFTSPIGEVWRALTDPRMLARWLMENDFEARIGHVFTMRDPPTPTWRGWIECKVLELDPPHRMVWSWNGGEKDEVATRIVFELKPDATGTRLVFRHEGEVTPEQGESFGNGWKRKIRVLHDALGPDYARRVAFASSCEVVFDAIATIEGLRGWWTTLASGSDAAGGTVKLEFEGLDEHILLRLERVKRPSSALWTVTEHTGLDDWNGTQLQFEVAPRGPAGCELRFRHVGLVPRFPCYEMCEGGWDHFLASLVAFVDHGEGSPFGAPDQRAGRRRKSR